MIDEKIYKVYEKDIDHLHLTNCKLKEIMIQLKQNLKKLLVQQIYCVSKVTIQIKYLCHKTLGGNTYSKNSMIIYIINDKF